MKAALSAAALLCIVSTANAQSVLFQIGKSDHGNAEFYLAPGHWSQYTEDPYYIVGQSKPSTDWPYVLPGPADSWAGGRAHTGNIVFDLEHSVSTGSCKLTLSLIDTHSSIPPEIKITINGRSKTVDTVRGAGDDSINGQPDHGRPSTIEADFSADTLTSGVNHISIETTKGSWLLYDSVTFTAPSEDTLGSVPPFINVMGEDWLPDVLKKQNNQLDQVLRLSVFNSGSLKKATLHVSGEPDRIVSVPPGNSVSEQYYPESRVAQQSKIQLFLGDSPVGDAHIIQRTPCRHYTIYCIEHSHMDIGYKYLQPKALALHQQYLEVGLKLNKQSMALPVDDRFRWNLESLYEADDWLAHASPAQKTEFASAVKTGNLGLSATYCNELSGLCRPEELAALLDCANRLRTTYNIPIDSAMISDVPGSTWGLVSMLAQGGVRYLSLGPNGGDHIGRTREFDNKAFYWVSPSGKDKVLVWQSVNGYYPLFSANKESLEQFLVNFDQYHPDNPYDIIYDRHTEADNGPADLDLAPFVHDWNAQYAYPHLVLSTTSTMFHAFDARYGKTLPIVRGDYTGYWEDGAASTARETAINRNAAEAIAQDQMLYAMLDPTGYPQTEFDNAWKSAVLYDEHTWGADVSASDPESDFTKSQWNFKKQFALDAAERSQNLRAGAFKGITVKSNTIAVFNTTSWKRSGLVVLSASQSSAGDRVRGEFGNDVPSQRLSDGTLAFLALDIPPTCSRKFQVLPGKSRYKGSATATDAALRTRSVSLTLDPSTGTITHWKCAGIDHDLVNPNDKTCRGLNDYLYVLGASNSSVQYAADCHIRVVDSGPLVASVRIDSTAPGSKTLTRLVQVVDGLDDVFLTDSMDRLAVREDEAVQIGYNFNVPGATVRMDMPWSVVRPDVDQTSNADRDVFPVGRWADISNGEYGVTCANLDSPMMEISEIASPREGDRDWLRQAKSGSSIYWNVMNNYWHTNYKAYQPGIASFRYVLRAHKKFDQSSNQRFGISQSQPLIVTEVRPNHPDAHLPLTLNNESIQITECHPIAHSRDWLVRLFNGSNQPQSAVVGWNGKKAINLTKTDLWGNSGKPIANPLTMAPMEVLTVRARS